MLAKMKFSDNFIMVVPCSCCPFDLTLLWEHILSDIYIADCGDALIQFLIFLRYCPPARGTLKCVFWNPL